MPVVVVFFTLNWSGGLLVMIFIAIFAQSPDASAGSKAGQALILGNALGGLAAIAAYNVLVAVPNFGFFIALMCLASLFFGSRVFSDHPMAPLYGMALKTLVLLIGSATMPFGGEVDAKFYTRLAQIALVAIYTFVVFTLMEDLKPVARFGNPRRA